MSWILKQEIDLQRGYKGPQVWPDALMVSGDDKAHTWRVKVLDGGVPADLSGAAVTGYFVREDGVTVAVPGVVGGHIVSVTLAQNCYAVAGRLGGVLRMVLAGKTVTLSSVVFTVKRLTTDSMVDPGRAFRTTEVLSDLYDTLQAQTAALASGSPKGTYATVADLTTADPDHSSIYVVTADGQWYYWGGSAWAAGGVYQALGVGDGTVSPEKTTFLTPPGKNLFNLHNATPAQYLRTSDGQTRSDGSTPEAPNNYVSDYIPVTPGTTYSVTRHSGSRMAYYNASKAFVSGENMPETFTAPAGVSFLRFSFSAIYLDAKRVQLEVGSAPTPFEPYGSVAKASEMVNLKRIDPYEVGDTIVLHKRDHNTGDMTIELGIHVPGVMPGLYTAWMLRRYINVDPAQNYNIWRTMDVGVSRGSPPVLYRELTTRGEFDMALQIAGRDDFIGGSSHGDEVMVGDGLATLDGVPVDIVSAGEYRLQGKEFRLLTQSDLYDPANHSTLVGKHRKEWIISKTGGFRLRHRVEWLVPLQMDRSFMAMLPIYRKDPPTTGVQVTDRGFNSISGEVYDITDDRSQTLLNVPTAGVKRLCVYGNETGIWAMGEVRNTPELPGSSAWVSTDPNYNKMYFDFCGLSYNVAAGDVWECDVQLLVTYKGGV